LHGHLIAIARAECQEELGIDVVWQEIHAAIAVAKIRTARMKATERKIVHANPVEIIDYVIG
jgi:hypothetical protein